MVSIIVGILTAASLAAQDGRDVSLNCPTTIDVTETATGVAGWRTGNATAIRRFERISIFNGKDGGPEYELAPDDEKQQGSRITQTWRLAGYRDMNLFVRCRYRDTQVVLSKDIPKRLQVCTFLFESDKSGKITGEPSFVCR